MRVVTNPIWLGVTATTVTENTIVSAYLTYAAKYLQAQFRVPAHLASIHTGKLSVVQLGVGSLQNQNGTMTKTSDVSESSLA